MDLHIGRLVRNTRSVNILFGLSNNLVKLLSIVVGKYVKILVSYSSFSSFTIYASGNFKRVTYTKGGYGKAFLK